MFADTLTETQRRRARIHAYLACYCGCISEVMQDSSAIIIIFLTMLGAGSTKTMLSTSFTGCCGMVLMIPAALIVSRFGHRRITAASCIIGCIGFLLLAASPWFGKLAGSAALLGCFIYSVQRSSYSICWFAMLDNFLRPQDRGAFFGFMRFTYLLISGGIFFLLGLLMGDNPPLALMQIVLAVTGLLVLGRLWAMLQFPVNPAMQKETVRLKKALAISTGNGPLTAYSVYCCLLTATYTSVIPAALIYLKSYVNLGASTVQIISTIGIAGSITGNLIYGAVRRKFKLKNLELAVHLLFATGALLLFALDMNIRYYPVYVSLVIFIFSLTTAFFLCNNSLEILSLAKPGNKNMAVAFAQTYANTGAAIGRFGTSMLLGSGVLAAGWQLWGRSFCHFHTLFLFYGIIALVLLLLYPTLPAVVPRHHDYYEPGR